MNTASTASHAGSPASSTRLAQLCLAALLGFVVIGVTGFSHIDAVHNAAHDYRHSMAFPCH